MTSRSGSSRAGSTPKPTPIYLLDITPGVFAQHSSHVAFTGLVKSRIPPKDNGPFSFTLAPLEGHPGCGEGRDAFKVVVVNAGRAAKEASEAIQMNDEVILLGQHAVCEPVPVKAGQEPNLDKRRFRVVYKKQIDGFIADRESGEFVPFGFPSQSHSSPSHALRPKLATR